MTRDAKDFAEQMVREGFAVSDGGRFMEGPESLAWHNDKPYLTRTCYEYVDGRWEGFATMDPLDKPTPAHWLPNV